MVEKLEKWLGRTIILYLITGIILFLLIDVKQMKIYRLTSLDRWCSSYPSLLIQHPDSVNSRMLYASLTYYKILSTMLINNYRVYETQGQCYFFLKDYARSQEMFKKAFTLSPRSFWLGFDQAAAAYMQGKCEIVSPLLKQILQENIQEQYQGTVVSRLRNLSSEDQKQLLIKIPPFVQEVRTKSLLLLNYCDVSKGSEMKLNWVIPVMHPWSLVISPGKEAFYD